MAGITISVSRVEDTIPPIIGTAMRCITSAPVPWLHMIGSRPAMMAQTDHAQPQRGHTVLHADHPSRARRSAEGRPFTPDDLRAAIKAVIRTVPGTTSAYAERV